MGTKTCHCGHAFEKHSDELACVATGCDCIHFEEDRKPRNNAYIAKAAPDEPVFVLLGRDPIAAKLVKDWAEFRFRRLPNFGIDNPEEMAQIAEAVACGKAMEAYAAQRQQDKNRARIAAEKAAVATQETT